MRSVPPLAASSDAPQTTESTSTVAGTSLPLSFAPETSSSLPTRVPVRCNTCGTVFIKPRSTLLRVKPGTPLHCSRACQSTAARVALTCAGCGAQYTKLRCEAEKAHRNGLTRSFCTKKCYQTAEQQRHAGNRPCAHCGRPRPPERERFCSDECRERHFVSSAACEHCGVTFELPRYELAKKRRLGRRAYCSKECVADALAARTSATCEGCSVKMPRWNGRRFCTPDCLKKHRAQTRRLPNHTCPECSTTFRPKSSRAAYCSRVCANEAHSRRMIGSGNSRYLTGTSYADWFRKMRPLILLRDGGLCVVCRQCPPPMRYLRKGVMTERGSLVIHHVDEHPANNLPENLVTLCKGCHMVHHKSTTTPYPWFGEYAESATRSMTSKWRETATSLRTKYSSTTA